VESLGVGAGTVIAFSAIQLLGAAIALKIRKYLNRDIIYLDDFVF
jgi:hypothetical protein